VASPNFPKKGIWSDFFTGKPVDVSGSTNQITLLPGEFHVLSTETWNMQDLGVVPWKVPNLAILGTIRENTLRVFPNPSAEYIQIEVVQGDEVQVFDVMGRMVLTQRLANGAGRVSLGGLSNGGYLIRVGDEVIKLQVNK
jgi:hypothetical protein